jgi:hypothetical protein
MRPAGLEAFELRRENRSGIYAYEQRAADLRDADRCPGIDLLVDHRSDIGGQS